MLTTESEYSTALHPFHQTKVFTEFKKREEKTFCKKLFEKNQNFCKKTDDAPQESVTELDNDFRKIWKKLVSASENIFLCWEEK
jgi:hypothetical protein